MFVRIVAKLITSWKALPSSSRSLSMGYRLCCHFLVRRGGLASVPLLPRLLLGFLLLRLMDLFLRPGHASETGDRACVLLLLLVNSRFELLNSRPVLLKRTHVARIARLYLLESSLVDFGL